MNNDRRKALGKIAGQLREMSSQLSGLKDELESLKGEEEEYKDNMPENLQGSERYEAAEAAVSALDEALDMIPDLDEVADKVEEAAE